jgi:hypothetical protein
MRKRYRKCGARWLWGSVARGFGFVIGCSVYLARQLRLRVLEALELRVKQFVTREELWPLRIPHQPLPLHDVVEQALGDAAPAFDVASLRSRPLISLQWEDGATWEAWVIVLPSKIKLYCDSSDDESRILASGGRNEGDESDRIFLELLAESAGAHFGIEMAGGAPVRVRTSLTDRAFAIDLFLSLFEVSGMESEIRRALAEAGVETHSRDTGIDFRADVEAWLDHVTSSSRSRTR